MFGSPALTHPARSSGAASASDISTAVGGDYAAGAGQELNCSDAAMGAQTHRAARPEFTGTQFLALAVQFEDPGVRAGAAAALEPALAARKVYFEVDPSAPNSGHQTASAAASLPATARVRK
jgi:hypothetical protein